jgi:phosphatidylserine synthase
MDYQIVVGLKLLCAAMIIHMCVAYLLRRELRAANDYWFMVVDFAGSGKYVDSVVLPIWKNLDYEVRRSTWIGMSSASIVLLSLFFINANSTMCVLIGTVCAWLHVMHAKSKRKKFVFQDQNLLLLEYRRLKQLARNDAEFSPVQGAH